MNRIYIVFDTPTIVGRVRVWNYRKTPKRGTRLLSLLLDDTIIASDELPECGHLDINLSTTPPHESEVNRLDLEED